MFVVKQPGLGPVVTGAIYQNKRVFLTGQNFEAEAVAFDKVSCDGEVIERVISKNVPEEPFER